LKYLAAAYPVWGAWFVVLGRYLEKGLGFSGTQIGSVYGTMALGAIFSMMVAGQLADRLLASEYLMAIFHLAGAVLLFVLSRAVNTVPVPISVSRASPRKVC